MVLKCFSSFAWIHAHRNHRSHVLLLVSIPIVTGWDGRNLLWEMFAVQRYMKYYNDVIMGNMGSISPVSPLFAQPVIQEQIKENIKAPLRWLLCGEFTGDQWIPPQIAGNAENVSIWWRHHGRISIDWDWTSFIHHFWQSTCKRSVKSAKAWYC